ncbi:Gfo/Idh/MocA family protein [Neolewinella antarctica]|uniref:Dehydrogenase n=1 Tax=Neolewinella antarctica TaxID=442734 RepID=A0ABX0XH32_9BACT|nr:Gfo/Idh/MocA family oxidoreductase [Neolewinella antarctica]NJC28460.1 putative dehydrogenase [Neolewinella antarctica]
MNNRRNFLRRSAIVGAGVMALPKLAYSNILGANERINVAIIGVRSRAKALTKAVGAYPNATVLFTCDVDDKIIEKNNVYCQETLGYVPKVEKDFRKILDNPEIDAVFIATPEHWHAPMAISALKAGKHVYVEKPCSHNPWENEMLVKAQQMYGKKVQMGNQQRSASTSAMAVKDISEGIIGDVYKGEAYYGNNRGSIGTGKVMPAPDHLDWELWQGPAPRQAYQDNVHPYNWHWFKKWGTGEIHNNGTHEIDVCRWAMGLDLPKTVTSFGGKFTYDDDWQFADNQQVTYGYDDDKFITWTGHSRGMVKPNRPGRGATIYGSKGAITLSRNNYELFDLGGNLIKEEKEKEQSATTNTVGAGGLDVTHVGNFLDSIRMDVAQNSPISDASVTTMMCHLGNIAQEVGRTLRIDQNTGHVFDDDEAMSHWKREYEYGWEPKLS